MTSARNLAKVFVGGAVLFASVSYAFSPADVFHILNCIALAAGVVTIMAFSPGLRDAWLHRSENGISPAHLLTFGITFNWVGFCVRLARWYFQEAQPASGLEQWTYNVGLWVSVAASGFLIGAVALSDPPWTRTRLYAHAAIFFLVVAGLWFVDLFI